MIDEIINEAIKCSEARKHKKAPAKTDAKTFLHIARNVNADPSTNQAVTRALPPPVRTP